MRLAVMLLSTGWLVLAHAGVARRTQEVKDFGDYLKKSVNGKPHAPLTPALGELQNEEERSGKFEGDIVLTEKQRQQMLQDFAGGRNGMLSSRKMWTNKTVYYHISSGAFTAEQLTTIKGAIRELSTLSCLKFKPKDATTINYVHIKGEPTGCHSVLGMVGGAQALNLGRGCFLRGTVLHELLHATGFYHQQSTHDRDDYVSVHWSNIQSGHTLNFQKLDDTVVSNFGQGYDYGSVMHYSEYAYSRDGAKTLIPLKQTTEKIGQRIGLSKKDIKKLNKMYRCPER